MAAPIISPPRATSRAAAQAMLANIDRSSPQYAGMNDDDIVALLMGGPAPVVTPAVSVSPANPAPGKPGVVIEAPAPMAPPVPQPIQAGMQNAAATYLDQAKLAAAQTQVPRAALEKIDVAPPPAPELGPKLSSSPEDIQAMVQGNMNMVTQAKKAASVDPELAGYFDKVNARAEAELGDVRKDRSQQNWMALAMAGAKMAASQSPYFATALAEGLQTGLTGFDKARAEAAERKARLQDRQEDIVLKRYEALKAAQGQAVADLKAGYEITASQAALVKSNDENIFNASTVGSRVAAVKAQAEKARTEADLLAQYGGDEKAAEIAYKKAATRSADASGRAALMNAYTNAREASAKIEQVKQLSKAGEIPGPVSDVHEQLLTTARARRTDASKLSSRDPSKARMIAQADQLEKEAEGIIAPYFVGRTENNPIYLTPENKGAIPPGQYFKDPRVQGVVGRQTPGAGSVVDWARNRGSAAPPGRSIIGAPPPGAVRLKNP